MIYDKKLFVLAFFLMLSSSLFAMRIGLEQKNFPEIENQRTALFSLDCFGGQISNVPYHTLAISPLFKSLVDNLGDKSEKYLKINVGDFHCQFLAPMLVHMEFIANKLLAQVHITAESENRIIAELSENLKKDDVIADVNNINFIINTARDIKNNIFLEALLYLYDYLHDYSFSPRIERHKNWLNLMVKSPVILDSEVQQVQKHFDAKPDVLACENLIFFSVSKNIVEHPINDLPKASVDKKVLKRKRNDDASEEKKKKRKKLAKSKIGVENSDKEEGKKLAKKNKNKSSKNNKKSAEIPLFKCSHNGCLYVSEYLQNIKTHEKWEHFKCSFSDCNFYGVKTALEKHTKKEHPALASEGLPSNASLRVANKKKNIIPTKNSDGYFVCEHFGCGFSALKQSTLLGHADRKHFPCPHDGCDFSLLKRDLSKHCKEIHKKGDYVCTHSGCEYHTYHRQQWEYHIDETHFDCQHEGCQFSSVLQLYTIHKKTAHQKDDN